MLGCQINDSRFYVIVSNKIGRHDNSLTALEGEAYPTSATQFVHGVVVGDGGVDIVVRLRFTVPRCSD